MLQLSALVGDDLVEDVQLGADSRLAKRYLSGLTRMLRK